MLLIAKLQNTLDANNVTSRISTAGNEINALPISEYSNAVEVLEGGIEICQDSEVNVAEIDTTDSQDAEYANIDPDSLATSAANNENYHAPYENIDIETGIHISTVYSGKKFCISCPRWWKLVLIGLVCALLSAAMTLAITFVLGKEPSAEALDDKITVSTPLTVSPTMFMTSAPTGPPEATMVVIGGQFNSTYYSSSVDVYSIRNGTVKWMRKGTDAPGEWWYYRCRLQCLYCRGNII